jgi:hypothetical protein
MIYFLKKNGDKYEGDFKDGLRTGQGIFETKDGERYSGNFEAYIH